MNDPRFLVEWNQTNVVYKFSCMRDKIYIGQTKRFLRVRREHINNIKLNEKYYNVFMKHLIEYLNDLNTDRTSLLQTILSFNDIHQN